ncbi:MAG: winged helix-turn-helix transcriptional regulator [Nitrososphaerota archaeon]|jgi:DNA-binding transcriptional ArsR family regulator|nr:winged helix-turn-helix transcriptional regulator [Nitrososphaerota archaeon]
MTDKSRNNAVFAAVSNPTRREILDMLKSGDRQAGDLVAAFPKLPQPAISRHLKILREAGLVRVSPQAQKRVYSLQAKKLREVDNWVSLYRQFWSTRLDSLRMHLDSIKREDH